MSSRSKLPTLSLKDKAQGFTMVELVAVIVLLGILSVGSSQFIRSGVEIYNDTIRRDDLAQQGRYVVERISRELRRALPGSVRVNSSGSPQCLEFIPIEAASIYLGVVSAASQTSFQTVDFDFPIGAILGRQVIVYPLDNNDVYQPASLSKTPLSSVAAVSSNERTVNFSSRKFAQDSPQNRFYIFSGPVSFCVSEGSLMRYEGYAMANDQPVPPSSGGALLAEQISLADTNPGPAFSYSAGTLQRASVVHLDLRFVDSDSDDEWARFSQAVFLRNTP